MPERCVCKAYTGSASHSLASGGNLWWHMSVCWRVEVRAQHGSAPLAADESSAAAPSAAIPETRTTAASASELPTVTPIWSAGSSSLAAAGDSAAVCSDASAAPAHAAGPMMRAGLEVVRAAPCRASPAARASAPPARSCPTPNGDRPSPPSARGWVYA